MASGDTKTEAMLNVLGNGGSGDEFRGCCNTKVQDYILDAIDRINALDPSGGTNAKTEFVSENQLEISGKTEQGDDATPWQFSYLTDSETGDTVPTLSDGVDTWTLGGGGGGVTPVQTTGTSTTDVMSQDATTKLIYPDITNKPAFIKIGPRPLNNTNVGGVIMNGDVITGTDSNVIAIGFGATSPATVGGSGRAYLGIAIGGSVGKGDYSIAIGDNAFTYSDTNHGYSVALGTRAVTYNKDSVALGSYARPTRDGEVNVGTHNNGSGYNSTNYRVIGGVHDPVDAHDAATKGYVDSKTGATLYVSPSEYDVYAGGAQSGIHFYKESSLTNAYTAEEIREILYGSNNDSGDVKILIYDNSDPDYTYKYVMKFAGGTVLDQNSLGTNGMMVYFNYDGNGDKVSLYLESPTDTTFSLSA